MSMMRYQPMRKEQIIKCALVTGALLCVSTGAIASASSASSAPIAVDVGNNGLVYVYFPNSIRSGTIPTCAANIGGTLYRLVFDSTTAAGKSMLAGLEASLLAGYGVWPVGTGDCGVDASTESLKSYYQDNN
jgi:hypothetical protein